MVPQPQHVLNHLILNEHILNHFSDVEHVLNHLLDKNLPIQLKLGTLIKNDGFHKEEACHFFRDQIQGARLVAILLYNMSPTISQTYVVQFCSNLAQAQYMMGHTCPHFILRYDEIWLTDRLAAISVECKYGLAL